MFYKFKIRSNTFLVWVCKIILIILIISNLFLVWNNSSKESKESNKSSTSIAKTVTEHVIKDYQDLSKPKQQEHVKKTNIKIRSIAHFAEFIPLGLFAFLLVLTFLEFKRKDFWYFVLVATVVSLMFSSFCGLLDEIHQIFVKGRSFQLVDILTDSLGALSGCSIALLIIFVFKKRLTKK